MKKNFHFFDINSQIIFFSIIFPCAIVINLQFKMIEASSIIMFLPVFLIFLYLFSIFLVSQKFRKFNYTFVLIFMLFFALFIVNLVISEEQLITFIKLFSFLNYFMYGYLTLILLNQKISLEVLSTGINISLLIFLVFAYESIGTTYFGQTVAMYAAGGVIFSIFAHNNLRKKFLYNLLPVYMLIFSASRGSMLLITFLLAILSIINFKKKYFWKALFVFGVLSIIVRPDIVIMESFTRKILYSDISTSEALYMSAQQRRDRAYYGMKIFDEKPILGIGIGSDIGHKMEKYIGKNQTTHNGYITLLIEGGYLVGIPTLVFILIAFSKILYRNFKKSSNLSMVVFLFTLFHLLRALGENYLLYNFGNLLSILFIFFLVHSFFSKGDYVLKS